MQTRTKQIVRSRMRRAIRWEFWPMSLFYAPIFVYIVYLVLRHRGLTFLSVNPGLPMSGLIGERKAASLKQLSGSEFLANFEMIPAGGTQAERVSLAKGVIKELGFEYPVVLKPDFGQRGLDVAVIRTEDELRAYLGSDSGAVLLQEHIEGEEFGIFYMRNPENQSAKIFSITEKTFPVVIGNGKSTFEELLMQNPRTHYMAEFLLNLHADKLDRVLAEGERFKVVEIGSHCRGSVFLDGNHHITAALTAQIDALSQKIEGFNFGRYDVRVPSSSDLQAGYNFKVLEVNGVTSESTDIYDPKNSVVDAYRVLFRQWREAFEIGAQVISQGAQKVSLMQFLAHLKKTYY